MGYRDYELSGIYGSVVVYGWVKRSSIVCDNTVTPQMDPRRVYQNRYGERGRQSEPWQPAAETRKILMRSRQMYLGGR